MTYEFPDARDNNRPIGKPIEVYFFEFVELSNDEFIDFLFVALYEVEEKRCFDTRVYVGCDTVYSVDYQMSEYLNGKYFEVESNEYPLLNGVLDEINMVIPEEICSCEFFVSLG